MGTTKFQGGKYDEAIQHFTILRDLFPEDYRYSFAIGAALHYKKQYQEAAGVTTFIAPILNLLTQSLAFISMIAS